jgi:hypothetical protein
MRYFDHLFTVADIKGQFKDLAMKHHPDRGGDTATMQTINAQYHEALKRCNGERTTGENNREHRYEYDAEVEQAIMDKIMVLIALRMPEVKVALIGTWIWVTGETKPWKEQLKVEGLRWHVARKCWYFTTQKRKSFYSRKGLSQLADRYGYKEFRDNTLRITH